MPETTHTSLNIQVDQTILKGELYLPENATNIIVFCHGSGSSRFSHRNMMVASALNKKQFGTLLFDLLTESEDLIYANRFNIELLTKRLIGITKWLEKHPIIKEMGIAYFGASTGAAAAINAAAVLPEIKAVVSRGGRPDLAMDNIAAVKAPTLFIVGSLDEDVLALNKIAFNKLQCDKKLELVMGATHLFEEKGKMEKVIELASKWFEKQVSQSTEQIPSNKIINQ